MSKQKKNNRKNKSEPASYINLIIAIVNLVTALVLLLEKLRS